ncbi:hypothetical protein A1O1_00325 [Capronia coronata CBS 617.96]|uniref:Helicase ATP-binding domain-containing protein n=1 Tax=Capronia coronata CBS 617.96 TaxID=1182541 RepID=W9Z0V4_9EURO|nr:uncharacterized protein A1O1_00325 [Capronia coronata CBS 617.96]EXJ95206.1 hypothetical protein A1O1_00325 [Capronia coronata CBS 617.96]
MVKKKPQNASLNIQGLASTDDNNKKSLGLSDMASGYEHWEENCSEDVVFAHPPKNKIKAATIGLRFRIPTKGRPSAKPLPDTRVYRKLVVQSDAGISNTSKDKPNGASDSEALQILQAICAASPKFSTDLLTRSLLQIPQDQICLPIPEGKTARTRRHNADDGGAEEEEDDDDDEGEDDNNVQNGYYTHNGLDNSKPPMSDINDIFRSLAQTGLKHGLKEAIEPFMNQNMRLFTMCSGTESPIIAMDLIQKALKRDGVDNFNYQHLGSAEIEPQKQAFIERNFRPPVIFRDVTEFNAYAHDKIEANKNHRPPKEQLRPYTAYGRRADPPDGVHILVAGSSCVDYSILNSKKEQDGESRRTLLGIVAYAKAHQPNIVILENVASAPWDEVSDKWNNDDLQYHVTAVQVNSLNYYLPQTRVRGYCLLINKKHALNVGLDLKEARREFVRCMARFQRRASSPYSDFILKEDDVRLALAKTNPYDFNTREKMVNWTACRKRHLAMRAQLKLGMSTPYTRRQNNAQCKLDDHAWQRWVLGQTERVIDTLDINQLRYVCLRDYDMRMKFRNFNISQNIDRDEDRRQWGVVGCITPRGSLFHTARGGPLVGLEVFGLQGMPIGDLNLSKESSNDLQDLAGNAMTTTVVGAAILSGLIACHKAARQQHGSGRPESIFQKYVDEFWTDSETDGSALSYPLMSGQELITQHGQPPLKRDHIEFSLRSAIPIDDLIVAAQSSQPLCRCESLGHLTNGLKICPVCFYTTCNSCSRDPHHGLRDLSVQPGSRRLLRSFIDDLIECLPPILALRGLSASVLKHFTGRGSFSGIQAIMETAIQQPLYFQGVKFDRSWKATYESGSAMLQLDFTPIFPHRPSAPDGPSMILDHVTLEPTWLLFVRPPSTEPAGSKSRILLQHPVAKMRCGKDLMSGDWALWNGPEKSYKLQISGCGTKVPAWEQTLGIKRGPFNKMDVFPELEIRSATGTRSHEPDVMRRIVGKYGLFQDCPAASGTLHRRVAQSESEDSPIFLFLDPQPLGDALLDCFVFATQPPRGTSVDNRSVLAKLQASWRPALVPDAPQGEEINCELLGHWTTSPGLKLAMPEDGRQIHKWYQDADAYAIANVPCHDAASTSLVLELPLNQEQRKKFPQGHVITIDLENKPDALHGFGWILSHASKVPYLYKDDDKDGKWQSGNDAQVSPCLTCAPQPPILRWLLKKVGQRDIIKPFEDPEDAAVHEDALKHRPKTATATIHCHGETAFLDIKVNLPTLIHRAKAQFSSSPKASAQGIEASWRLARHDPLAARPTFGSLELGSNLLEQPIATTTVRGRHLWSSQRKALAWMQKQEREPPIWKEMAVVESILPALGWRLEARAATEMAVRCGIIADDVGAGKTTTSLGLVALDYKSLQSPTPRPFVAEPLATHINTDATLVLAPRNILKQWESECVECLGWKKYAAKLGNNNPRPYYILVHFTRDFLKISQESLQAASLILAPWDMFEDDKYWTPLRKLACAPDIPSDPGRAFSEWLESSLQTFGQAWKQSAGNKTQFWGCWDDIRAGRNNYDRFKGFKTRASNKAERAKQAKAAKGAAAAKPTGQKAAKATTKTAGQKRTRADFEASDSVDATNPKSADGDSVQPGAEVPEEIEEETYPLPDDPFEQELDDFRAEEEFPTLLHLFSFRRVIVDEFTYIHGKTLLALLKLAAGSRWMLSGTPPIHDYDNVNTMAKLLGTRISTYDEDGGKFGFGRDGSKMVRDRSDAQEFQSYQSLVSAPYAKTLYDHATEFSAIFIRKNQPDVVLPPRHDHNCLFDLSPSEMVTYLEVDQIVEEQDITFNRKPTVPATTGTAKAKAGKKASVKVETEAETDAEEDEAPDDGDDESGDDEDASAIDSIKDELRIAVAQKSGPNHARMSAAPILAQMLVEISRKEIRTEGQVLQQLAQSHEKLLIARSEQLLKWLQELWYLAMNHKCKDTDVVTMSFITLMYEVTNGTLPDQDVLPIIKHLLWNAKENPVKPARKLKGRKPDEPIDVATLKKPDVQNELDLRMDLVHTLINDLARGFCRLRLLRLVSGLVDATVPLLGSCSGCGNAVPSNANHRDIQVSCGCGHIVACPACASPDGSSRSGDKLCCPCFSADHVKPASHFVAEGGSSWSPSSPSPPPPASSSSPARLGEGSRPEMALSILRQAIAKEELALVFVQFEDVKTAFVQACEKAGIGCIDGFKNTRGAVGRFQKAAAALAKGKPSGSWVLVLKTDSADAAGWNLHMANHVLFLSPLLLASREERAATMEQAVGRALRPRQEKPVHVYHLAARGTIEQGMVASL